jgi:hypothetical protein
MFPQKFIETLDIQELNFVFNKLLNASQKFLRLLPDIDRKEIFFLLVLSPNNFGKDVTLELKNFILVEITKVSSLILILI